MAFVNGDPPSSLECVPVLEPDSGLRQDKRTELEMKSSREKFSVERGGLAIRDAARSDEAFQLLDGGTTDASPSALEKHADGKTKVGKGLESIGDLTVDALQRIASAVGGSKVPVVVMANVEGLGSNANSPTSSCGTPLVERVSHLEMQMAMLEEKYNSKTLATEVNLSPRSHPTTPRSTEKLRTARSLLQETETKGTLVERVQILEKRLTEHVESIENALSNIRSKLIHIDSGKLKPENLDVQDARELLESPSGEEFHDADQGSGSLESLETLEQKPVAEAGASSDMPSESRGTSPTPQEALVKEFLAPAPTAELAPEVSADKGSTVLPSSEAPLASSMEEPQNTPAQEPSAAVSNAKFSESIRDTGENSDIAAAEDLPLTSIVQKPSKTFVKEPSTAAPTVEPGERVQGNDAGNNAIVLSSLKPQLASTAEEPQGALTKEPLIAEASAKLKEPASQEDAAVLADGKLPLASTLEEPQNGTIGSVTENKRVQKESEHKAAEDIKVPAGKPETFANYVVEPKPFGHREKKKKEKRQDGVAERERKNSLSRDEKSKQPFKHLRDRFRHAFRSNKDS